MTTLLLRDARVVTMNDALDVLDADVLVRDGVIAAIGRDLREPGIPAVDLGGDWLLPGFVQAHIHLTQTLFRHLGEDRPLLRWLRERIWPLEGAHDPESNAVAAELGVGELLLGGTTCLLDMGTVHHGDAIAEVLDRTGIRAMFGKAMMDTGEAVPASLLETTAASLDESVRLARAWHGHDGDRLRYAFAPRFVLSCTPELQRDIGRLSAAHGWGIHTHASEQREEIAVVERLYGRRNIDLLGDLGLLGERTVVAHCVHVDANERALLASSRTSVCHCPSSNLKLGSGIADVVGLLEAGVNVAIGADGAPCNNGLDGFVETRLTHLLQCASRGPGALPAARALWLATGGGARALGWEDRIGAVTVGRDADLVRLRRNDFRTGDADDMTAIVCAGARDLVRDVWVRGRRLVEQGRLTTLDAASLPARARTALERVMARADVA